MRIYLLGLLLALCPLSQADQNPLPTSVGLYNFSTATATTTSAQALAFNAARAMLMIQNQGNSSVVVKFGSAISSSNEGIILAPYAIWQPSPAPVDIVYLKSLGAKQTVQFIEEVK